MKTLLSIDRPPTDVDVERIRLILSTYQDGSGMLKLKNGATLPGWRDFERSVAAAFNGHPTENKGIYDVLLDAGTNLHIGISCKMRNQLHEVDKTGRVSMELSNAAGKFWDILKEKNINQQNYQDYASQVGAILLHQVESWHKQIDSENGGTVLTSKSFFLSLQY